LNSAKMQVAYQFITVSVRYIQIIFLDERKAAHPIDAGVVSQ
jgi:hypothetical protein